jgi:4-hydroxybenzoate polyprenyltransferase
MTALQCSIGALNDVVDTERDAGRKAAKPIPRRLVSRDQARIVVVAAAGLGFLLVVPSGTGVLLIAGLGLACGYAYDFAFRGTAWSWLPFAVGIPLLPIFAWLGATGALPPALLVIAPAAVAGGAAIAIANARADYERDLDAGARSVATALGLRHSWWVHVGLILVALVIALGSLVASAVGGSLLVGAIGAAAVIGAGAVVGRVGDPRRREQAWEIEAVGLGLLGALWFAGLAGVTGT